MLFIIWFVIQVQSEQRAAVLEEKVKVAEEEAQLLARKSREAEEEIRRARESAVKVLTTLWPIELSNKVVNLLE